MNRNVRFLLIALATTAAFLLPIVVYVISSLPARQTELDRKQEQVVQASTKLAFLGAARRHRQEISKTVAAIEAEMARQRIAVPAQPSAGVLRADVDALVTLSAGKVLAFQQRRSFTVGSLRVLPVRIEIEGDRDALPAIVRDLETSPTLTTIEGATLRPIDDKRAQMWMVVDRFGVMERHGIIERQLQ